MVVRLDGLSYRVVNMVVWLDGLSYRVVNMVVRLDGLSYEEKLKAVGMLSLVERRVRGDVI